MSEHDNRCMKLIAMVSKATGELIGIVRFYPVVGREPHPEDPSAPRAIPEVPWSEVLKHGPGMNESGDDGEPILEPVAIVDCDGVSKLSNIRITARDGRPPEAKVEACMEVSADRTLRGPPIENTFGQARNLVERAREQGFPTRRLHHPTRDHKRIHCVGRLVRATPEERLDKARRMREVLEADLDNDMTDTNRRRVRGRINLLRDFEVGDDHRS